MQIFIEKTDHLNRKIKVAIPAIKINELVSNKIKTLGKQVKLNGFRSGHVPTKLIVEKYGSEVRQEVLNEMIDKGLNQAISDNKLSPVGEVELTEIKDDSNSDVECTFSLEIYPDIHFNNDFSTIQINSPKVVVTETDIDNSLMIIRQQFGKKILITDRDVRQKDIVTIDFVGFINEKEFPGNSGNNIVVEIGAQEFIDGFESGLIGAKTGDKIELKLKFPVDYAEKTLAGQAVVFKVEIKKIEEKQLAEVDGELAKSLGIKEGNPDLIRAQVKINLEKYISQLAAEKEKEQLIDLLLKNYPIELPNKLLIEEQKHLEYLFKQRNQEQGITIRELNNQTAEELKEQAKKNVHLALLLREVIKINNIQPDKQLLNQKLYEINNLFKNKSMISKYKNLYNNMKNSIINSMLTNLAIDFIISKVNKKEQVLTFEELNK